VLHSLCFSARLCPSMCAMRHVHLQLCRLIQAGGDACCCWRQCAETRRNFDDACMLLKQQCIRRHSASSSTHGVHFVPANQCLCCCLPHSCSQLAESFTQLWQITCVTQLHVTHCTLCAFLHPCVSAHCLAYALYADHAEDCLLCRSDRRC
jgi:hypothetical protein